MLSAPNQPTGAVPGAPPLDVPAPFVVDQGALRLPSDGAERLAGEPALAIEALAAAAEHALHLERATLEALQRLGPALKQLEPAERGRLLALLVTGGQPAAKVDAARRAGLLHAIAPEVERLHAMPRGNGLYKDVYVHTLRVLDAAPDDAVTRLAALLHDIAKPDTLVIEAGAARFPNHDLLGAERAARRLRALGFDNGTAAGVETLVRLHLRANSYEPSWTDSAVRRLHLDAGDNWPRLLDLSYADVTSARPDVVARARRRVRELHEHARRLDRPVEVAPLDGAALMERFGRGPGRWIGLVKQHLIERVRDGSLAANDPDAAWHEAEAFVRALEQGEPDRPEPDRHEAGHARAR